MRSVPLESSARHWLHCTKPHVVASSPKNVLYSFFQNLFKFVYRSNVKAYSSFQRSHNKMLAWKAYLTLCLHPSWRFASWCSTFGRGQKSLLKWVNPDFFLVCVISGTPSYIATVMSCRTVSHFLRNIKNKELSLNSGEFTERLVIPDALEWDVCNMGPLKRRICMCWRTTQWSCIFIFQGGRESSHQPPKASADGGKARRKSLQAPVLLWSGATGSCHRGG